MVSSVRKLCIHCKRLRQGQRYIAAVQVSYSRIRARISMFSAIYLARCEQSSIKQSLQVFNDRPLASQSFGLLQIMVNAMRGVR